MPIIAAFLLCVLIIYTQLPTAHPHRQLVTDTSVNAQGEIDHLSHLAFLGEALQEKARRKTAASLGVLCSGASRGEGGEGCGEADKRTRKVLVVRCSKRHRRINLDTAGYTGTHCILIRRRPTIVPLPRNARWCWPPHSCVIGLSLDHFAHLTQERQVRQTALL